MYRTILVPLDGSPFGEHALPLALTIARRSGATLQVAHVHVPVAGIEGEGLLLSEPSLDFRAREREQSYLDEVVKRLQNIAPVPVVPLLLEGVAADALVQAPQKTGADLIVMTTHGRGPLSRFWLGSIADELVRRSSVPLLLVRPCEEPLDLGREKVLRNIVIPLDGSPLAEQILEPAIALGTPMNVQYTLLRVVKPVTIAHPDLAGSPINYYGQELVHKLESLQEQVWSEAKTYLEGVAGRLRACSLSVRTHVISNEQAAAGILEEAGAHQTDLIALETHGRGGLARLFLGSVADKVLRGGSLPMLVHRPPVHHAGEKSLPETSNKRAGRSENGPETNGGRTEASEPEFHPGCWHGAGRLA
jgi:nucleotide-binding universal stress UspA family protein